jgi:hypothetical protein
MPRRLQTTWSKLTHATRKHYPSSDEELEDAAMKTWLGQEFNHLRMNGHRASLLASFEYVACV